MVRLPPFGIIKRRNTKVVATQTSNESIENMDTSRKRTDIPFIMQTVQYRIQNKEK